MAEQKSTHSFSVDQIDHVELYVPDRKLAAEWYHDVLGLKVIPEYAVWAEDPKGPLMIGTRNGATKLALFQGEPQGSKRRVGFHLVAFRVSAVSFAKFISILPELNLLDERNRSVTKDLVADHQKAFSVYFCDPYGHHFEITTYEYDQAIVELDRI